MRDAGLKLGYGAANAMCPTWPKQPQRQHGSQRDE
jgi:hypothetical protein